MPRTFAITFDYLCPFARNANEHVIEALAAGADWEVTFTPYSLSQGHVPEGETAVWDREDPFAESGILALSVGLVVRDQHPEHFLDVHRRLFAIRHDEGLDLKDPAAISRTVTDAGLNGDVVVAEAREQAAIDKLRREHDEGVEQHTVWGVPTFIGADRAVFVRLMDRPNGDADHARRTIEHVVDLVDSYPNLHEFKQTILTR